MPDDPHELEDVTVTGQRARGPSPFSGLQWPTKAVGSGGTHGDTVDMDGNTTGNNPSDEEVQCATTKGRREWNKDAKAVEVIDRFLDAARTRFDGEDHFRNREYGALICEFSDGTIDLGPVFDGPFVGPPVGGRGTVDIPTNSCGTGTPLGFVHTHTSGNPLGSPGDLGYLQRLVDEAGADPARVSVYTIENHTPPDQTDPRYRVSRVPLSDADSIEEEGYEPEWVNPEAQPCPGDE